jgi:hypothetical protein
MRRHEKSQRVNIDEYFHGFEDGAEPVVTQVTQVTQVAQAAQAAQVVGQPAPTRAAPPFKAILAAKPGYIPPVLAPYQPQGRTLAAAKPLSSFDLASAHRAVASIKHQLIGDPEPSVPTHVFHPGPTGAISQASIPVQDDASAQSPLDPVSAAPSSARLWWGGLAALVGTTASALLVYAHSTNHPNPAPAQTQILDRQALTLGQRTFAQAGRTLPSSSAAAPQSQRTAEQAAMAQSMRLAYTAAELTQSALAPEDWQQVILLWRQAIDELQPIAADHPLFSQAHARKQIYEDNLAYAQGELETAPFRMAVKAAEAASKMASSASTPEDWSNVAAQWKEALSYMNAVSSQSASHEVAQTKRAEYATKFAYSQNRYLTLQGLPLGQLDDWITDTDLSSTSPNPLPVESPSTSPTP